MEILKRHNLWLMVFLAPLLLGNRGCESSSAYQHVAVEPGMECATCHDDNRTRETRPVWHNINWKSEHGRKIRQYGFKTDSTCALCHTQATCSSCHQQDKPKSHNEFWRLKGHGLAVGLDRGQCMTCHRGADFCQRCHTSTKPTTHAAGWGKNTNRHCSNCHFPLTSAAAQGCATCHTGTPSHTTAPVQPSNSLHTPTADCRSCHLALRHPDNGMVCSTCHAQ